MLTIYNPNIDEWMIIKAVYSKMSINLVKFINSLLNTRYQEFSITFHQLQFFSNLMYFLAKMGKHIKELLGLLYSLWQLYLYFLFVNL